MPVGRTRNDLHSSKCIDAFIYMVTILMMLMVVLLRMVTMVPMMKLVVGRKGATHNNQHGYLRG